MTPDSSHPTVSSVQAIVALDDQPVLRNLAITQCYSDLSESLQMFSGSDNTNWCTYATWASKTVGQFIRLGPFAGDVDIIERSDAAHRRWWQDSIERKLNALPAASDAPREFSGLFQVIIDDVSSELAAGNLKVFDELGPLFADMIKVFDTIAEPTAADVAAFTARLKPGATENGGQDLLVQAVEHYVHARFETDPARKAQHVLMANAATGLHEQIRLQPYIARSMDAPVADAIDRIYELLPRMSMVERLAHRVLRPGVADWLKHAFETANTKLYATAHLPDGHLHLGRKIPTPAGQSAYPDSLMTIDLPGLATLLRRYEALEVSSKHIKTHDWASLDQRMHFILQLFRSRQQDAALYTNPFTEAQTSAIRTGQIPDGHL